jgi:hypothetical protein
VIKLYWHEFKAEKKCSCNKKKLAKNSNKTSTKSQFTELIFIKKLILFGIKTGEGSIIAILAKHV